MIRHAAALLYVLGIAAPLSAQQTTTYSYDVLGRLVGSTVNGGIGNGTDTTIQYDPAGNRQRYQVSGAPNLPQSSGRFVVVPLNGFTIIPLP